MGTALKPRERGSCPTCLESHVGQDGQEKALQETCPESRPGGALLPILATLQAHPEGVIVATLAAELGASVDLIERRLYSLKRQGLVKTERLGEPPITHWLAS